MKPEISLGRQTAKGSDDTSLAADLAQAAGELLLTLQSEVVNWQLDHKWLKDEGDRRSQSFLGAALQSRRPGDSVLSEEAVDDAGRLQAERVWIIDPLDGTREFSEGRHDWAVHVALWERGELTAGAVALPGLALLLDSTGPPATLERTGDRPLRIAASRSRPSALVERVANDLNAELVPMGSAGFKASAVVRGEVEAYIHSGGQYEWDSAAPVAVALGHGFHASRVDGTDLLYNRADPYLPDLLICRRELAGQLLSAIERGS